MPGSFRWWTTPRRLWENFSPDGKRKHMADNDNEAGAHAENEAGAQSDEAAGLRAEIVELKERLRRALAHLSPDVQAEASPAVKAVLDGVEATERELTATLERHGVRAIEAEG